MAEVMGIILAAGKGTRMRSPLPKVLHEVNGVPMVEHVLRAFHRAGIQDVVVVVGYRADLVKARLGDRVKYAHQTEQLGTGHAVASAKEYIQGFDGKVVVAYGDMPLISPVTLKKLTDLVGPEAAACSLVTLTVDNPPKAGRILRDEQGKFVRIVEAQDCTPEQLAINEINVGTYCFLAQPLLEALSELRNDNNQGEYYLTDVPEIIRRKGGEVVTVDAGDLMEALGVNDPEHLHVAEAQKDISFAESLFDLIDLIQEQGGSLEALLEWDRTRGRLPEE